MLEKAKLDDLTELQTLCTECYTQVFANHWNEGGLARYLDQEFGTTRLASDLTDDHHDYYFIEAEENRVGFVKMNFKSSKELSASPNCEIEKIYVLPQYSGQGLGKRAMRDVYDLAKERGKAEVFLCVLDTNLNSIAFYQKSGFSFHIRTRLECPDFKEELRGMHRMCLTLH